ncbi:regulator of sigma E protease [Candidatus Xenohaliotis californiensis]|uniref:Regulator of sigma E protease n=1 Tax=Candidatus Xenohaliotis californiensis TaxID=84677 RepID=A0ABM9N864_9RICK|nr:regulator of sigma E protease [Candidatus Xenohaliotis californiensis]
MMHDTSGKKVSLGRLGVGSNFKTTTKVSMINAAILAIKEVHELTIGTIKALKQIITGQRSYKELGGPLHIANTIGETAKIGIIPLIWLTAVISANLGLINMLPIPVLDGGHFIYYTWELIFAKAIPPHYQTISFRAGMCFIATIFLLITFNDIKHFIYKIFL